MRLSLLFAQSSAETAGASTRMNQHDGPTRWTIKPFKTAEDQGDFLAFEHSEKTFSRGMVVRLATAG